MTDVQVIHQAALLLMDYISFSFMCPNEARAKDIQISRNSAEPRPFFALHISSCVNQAELSLKCSVCSVMSKYSEEA